MTVRNKKQVSTDYLQFITARGVHLHPELYHQFIKNVQELEHKGKLCRLPSTILEAYHVQMPDRMALYNESCQQRKKVLSS